MSSSFVIVALFKDSAVKEVVSGDIDMAFVGEYAGLNLPVSEAGTKG